jgi:hypothetical protein
MPLVDLTARFTAVRSFVRAFFAFGQLPYEVVPNMTDGL